MLHVILLDCALELVPSEISSMKQVQQYARKRNRKPTEILLDQNYLGKSMLKLKEHERRGRPDIVYLSLMTLLESPLCKAGLLSVHLHLYDGRIVEIDSTVRLPRNYDRYVGLIEQLLVKGQVPPTGDPLLRIIDEDLPTLLSKLGETRILALEEGTPTSTTRLLNLLPESDDVPVILGVGGFPHGDMRREITSLFETQLSLDPDIMMAWHVCTEVLWIYSHRVQVSEKRLGNLVE